MFTRSTTYFAAILASIAFAEDVDQYSREGRDLAFVIAMNAPALSSPDTNLNMAVDPSQEPIYANRITAVGQRQ